MHAFTARFGAGAPAAATTIAALFAGLALGSAWFGGRVSRWRSPLRGYALLELGAVLAAALVPAITRASAGLAQPLHVLAADAPALALGFQTLFVFAALFLPTFLLGGTLPAATQAVDDGCGSAIPASSALYAANTVGGILGVLVVPFALLPAFGAARAYTLALGAGAALGTAAWCLSANRPERERQAPAEKARTAHAPTTVAPRQLGWLAFASGFTLLGLEVVWMRMLAQVHPSSVHAFAIVLALFLAALSLGAALGAALVRRGVDARRALERSWIAAGLLTLAAPIAFGRLTDGLEFFSNGARTGNLVWICASSFVPATLCAGLVLPLLLAQGARAEGTASRSVGQLLAANTAGSILGPLLATFVLFGTLGTWGSAIALGTLQLALPLALPGTRRWGLVVALPAVLLAWGAFRQPRVHLDSARGEELVWLREGSHGVAAAVRDHGSLRLKLDNSYTLGGTATAGDARWLGHLPLLLAEAPARVAFLGLGTGVTASAALHYAVQEVKIFELVPEVAAGAREVFAEPNQHVLEDPRVKLVLGDARTHLAAEHGRYDVIVGDLIVPWRKGESALLTREHLAVVRAALAPGGVFCQWLPAYQTSEEELRMVAATFLDVFPEAQLWRGDFAAAVPALGLIARADGVPIDPLAIDARIRARAKELTADNRYLAHPAGLWLYLVGALDARAAWVAAARRNTQDLPWLELIGARAAASGRPAPAFTGQRLLSFLDGVRNGEVQSGPASVLASLDEEHRRWRDLGAELFRASTLDEAGDEEAARRTAFAALDRLPTEIRASLFGPEALEGSGG
jgi:spermidine synthase